MTEQELRNNRILDDLVQSFQSVRYLVMVFIDIIRLDTECTVGLQGHLSFDFTIMLI